MKKRMSAAALALRMTWPRVAAFLAIMAAVQLWLFSRLPMGGDVLVEMLLDQAAGAAGWCKLGLMLLLVQPLAAARSRYDYTLNRLRIPEWECLAIWSVVYSGYFLLSWGLFLAAALGMLRIFAQQQAMDAMDFFLAAMRSRYFHTLLPFGEPWAFARNACMCLTYGTLAAHFPWLIRNKATWLGVGFYLFLMLFRLQNMGTGDMDMVWCLAFPALLIALILVRKWVASDED